jgi:uncharacterized membrane protein YdcZ (DUF606 family)
MHRAIDYLMAAAIGSTISFMVVFNTRLGEVVGMPVSFIFNHAIGIVVITLIMIVFRIRRGYPAKRQKAPWYFWFGGVFGFIILNANYITIVNIGASLAMATAVLGQSLGSLGFDLTGFMGRKTYPITPQKAISLLIGFLGIAIMASEGGTFAIPYVIIGTLTGVITMVQLVYNPLRRLQGGLLQCKEQCGQRIAFRSSHLLDHRCRDHHCIIRFDWKCSPSTDPRWWVVGHTRCGRFKPCGPENPRHLFCDAAQQCPDHHLHSDRLVPLRLVQHANAHRCLGDSHCDGNEYVDRQKSAPFGSGIGNDTITGRLFSDQFQLLHKAFPFQGLQTF